MVGQENLWQMNEQQKIVWCGGVNFGQDVSIRLVPDGMNHKLVSKDTEEHKVTLAVLKVHFSRLSKCSKYFETCLSERWTKPSSIRASLDFVLEHVSVILWSEEDEIRIREYTSSPDFPRDHAEDLVARLGLDVSEEDCHKQLCDVVQQCIRIALCNRVFLKELIQGIGSGTSSNFAKNVVTIVSGEAKNMAVDVGKECDGREYHQVSRLADKLLAICWILDVLLTAKVAEELVQCLVHLGMFAKILANAAAHTQNTARAPALELGRLILLIYREVIAGRLMLRIQERIALLDNWYLLLEKYVSKDGFDKAAKDLFSTLPLKQQMELIKSRKENYESYISASSLTELLKRSWPAMELKPVASNPAIELSTGSSNGSKP